MEKLQVPYNNDINILQVYNEYKNAIAEVYFAPHANIFPTARQYSGVTLEHHFKEINILCDWCNKMNIDTMLLLNGSAIELNDTNLNCLKNYINHFISHNLTGVVVSNPIMAEWIHHCYPALKIRMSILSLQFSINKLKQLDKLGYIKEICLPVEFNSNIDFLKQLKYETSFKYSLLVNSTCRADCPLYFWHHQCFNSVYNWKDTNSRQLMDSFFTQTAQFNNNSIASPFILPSMLKEYDDIVDCFKLEDRTESTEVLSNYIKYYALREDPDILPQCIHGSCLKNSGAAIELALLPIEYRKRKMNCKNECWKCGYCDELLNKII